MSLPAVHRCTCGHVSEWHYSIGLVGQCVFVKSGGPSGRTRCPDFSCGCPAVTWSAEAERLDPLREPS